MTQLALLLALSLLGLVLSFAFGRLEVKRGAVAATVKRAEGALERASVALLRLGGARGVGLLAVPALGLSGFALVGGSHGGVSGAGQAAFVVVALLGGAGSVLVQARLTLGLATRATSSAAAAAARGSVRAMRPLLRAAAAVAVFGEGLGVLGVAAAFASLYAVRGGFAAGANAELTAEVVRLLPAFALGAAVTALALAREGAVSASAARVGGGRATELYPTFETGDARDPALLAELVGHLVGELLPRALSGYVCGLCASISVALLATSGVVPGTGSLSCLVLVVLVRAFGSIGSICGVFAARATDAESPVQALWRGQASALLVALFGLGAALFWLEREHWGALFAAGATGLGAAALVGLLACLPLRRAATRELLDVRSSGEAAMIARGASTALSSLWPLLIVPALALALVERTLSPLAPAGLLLLTFMAGMLALGPLALSAAGFGLLTAHARGVATLARLEGELKRRASKLDEAGALGSAFGGAHSALAVALSLLLGLLSLTNSNAPSLSSFGAAALAIALGATLVLVFSARSTRNAVLGARLVGVEVELQLRELPKQGLAVPPADFAPSYKGCVEASLEAARGASVLELGSLLFAPFMLGLLLHGTAAPGLTAALVGFGVAAILGGLILSSVGRTTRAVLAELRRRVRASDAGLGPAALTQAESFGELVGVTSAASVEAFALVLALTVLCLAPLLR